MLLHYYEPFRCRDCGNRLGWARIGYDLPCDVYCMDCARERNANRLVASGYHEEAKRIAEAHFHGEDA